MKTLAFITLLFLVSCSTEEDVQPKFNCEQLLKDSDNAKTKMNNHTKNSPTFNASQAVKDKYQSDYSTLRQAYVDAYKVWNEHCK